MAKIENPSGSRISEIFAGDETIDPTAVYDVAFVTQGVPVRFGRDRRQMPVSAIDALEDYLRKLPVRTVMPGRVIAI